MDKWTESLGLHEYAFLYEQYNIMYSALDKIDRFHECRVVVRFDSTYYIAGKYIL